VADFLALVERDVVVVDETEGVGTCSPLAIWHRAGTDALAETTEFIGIRGIPCGFVMGVTTKLAMFKEVTCSRVQDGEGRWTTNFLQHCTEVCKAIGFLGGHGKSLTKARKAQRFFRNT
jgi:hypothetical protein